MHENGHVIRFARFHQVVDEEDHTQSLCSFFHVRF